MAMGRKSIFRGKQGGCRVQSTLSPAACEGFELARLQLAALYRLVYRVDPPFVSDADTIEYQFRGHAGARLYLLAQRARTDSGPNGGNRSAQTTSEISDEPPTAYQKGRRAQRRARP